MSEQRLFRARITFQKSGRLAMLSHLELARALERGVRRAGIPFAVTQGFSPHMRIGFGAALPVGIGGTQEVFDVYLTDYVAPAKLLDALRISFPEDLAPRDCCYIEPKADAASVAYPLCTYEVLLSEAPATWCIPETITVVRKRKEKVLTVADFLIGDMKIDANRVEFTLESKPTGSLRPDVLVQACLDALPPSEDSGQVPRVVSFTRIRQEEGTERAR